MNVKYIVSTFYVITHFTLIWWSSDRHSWSTHTAVLNNVNKLWCEEKHSAPAHCVVQQWFSPQLTVPQWGSTLITVNTSPHVVVHTQMYSSNMLSKWMNELINSFIFFASCQYKDPGQWFGTQPVGANKRLNVVPLSIHSIDTNWELILN